MTSELAQGYRSLSWIEAQLLGQQYYRQKDYTAALEAFSAAIELAGAAPLPVLDNRAAVYEKTGDLHAALRDAKAIIRADKSDAKGYLRAGKVLQLLGKPEAALLVYERGLCNVPQDDSARELVRGMHSKLLRNVKPSTNTDPLAFLPPELARQAVEYLRFIDLVNCLRVSRGWNSFLSAMPELWMNLDLSTCKNPVSVASVRACVKRSQGNILRATVNGLAHLEGGVLKHITTGCPQLEYLELCQGFAGQSLLKAVHLARNLTTLILSNNCEVTLDTISGLLRRCRRLSTAEFHRISDSFSHKVWWPRDMTSLKRLQLGIYDPRVLSSWSDAEYLSLRRLFTEARSLCDMTMHGWAIRNTAGNTYFSLPKELTNLNLRANTMARFPDLPSTIRSLVLSETSISTMGTPGCEAVMRDLELPNLEILEVNNSNAITPTHLDRFIKMSTTGLTKLAISRASGSYQPIIVECLKNELLRRLVELEVAGLDLADDDMGVLVEGAPNLERLDMSSTKITGVGVKTLLAKPGERLKWLGLNHCFRVGKDAVDMARQAGVQVEHRLADNVKIRRL